MRTLFAVVTFEVRWARAIVSGTFVERFGHAGERERHASAAVQTQAFVDARIGQLTLRSRVSGIAQTFVAAVQVVTGGIVDAEERSLGTLVHVLLTERSLEKWSTETFE